MAQKLEDLSDEDLQVLTYCLVRLWSVVGICSEISETSGEAIQRDRGERDQVETNQR